MSDWVNNSIFTEKEHPNWSLLSILTEFIYFEYLRDLEYFYFNFLMRKHMLKKNQELWMMLMSKSGQLSGYSYIY